MYIKTIRGINLCGQDFEHALEPVTLITGDNFTGKTTIATAVRYALSGQIPGVGNTPAHIWAAIAGNSETEGTVEVAAEFDTGRSSRLIMSRSKKGNVSVEGAVPADLALDPFLLNVRSFFKLTAAERTRVIFTAAGGVTITADDISMALASVEATPAKKRDEIIRELFDGAKKVLEKSPGDRGIEMILESWKEDLKHTKAANKVRSGAFAGMRPPLTIPPEPIDQSELRAKRDALIAKRGELAAILRDQISTTTQTGAVAKYRENLAKLKEELARIGNIGERPAVPTVLIERDAAQPEVDSLMERIETADRIANEAKESLAALEGVTICPTCGEQGGMTRVITSFQTRVKEAEASAAQAREKLKALLDSFGDVVQRAKAYDEAVAAWEAALQTEQRLEGLIQTTEAAIAGAEAELERIEGDRTEKLEALKVETEGLPAIEAAIADAEAKAEAFRSYKRQVAERDQKEQELQAGQCRQDVLDGSIKAITKVMEARSEAAFATVLELSEAFTRDLLNSPLEFVDGELGRRVSKKDQEQGRTAEVGSWIPWQMFSGTEELLGMAGFAIALARLAPFKLVVLDELGRLSGPRREAVMERVQAMVKCGVIDQCIMIEAGGILGKAPKGIRLITCEG